MVSRNYGNVARKSGTYIASSSTKQNPVWLINAAMQLDTQTCPVDFPHNRMVLNTILEFRKLPASPRHHIAHSASRGRRSNIHKICLVHSLHFCFSASLGNRSEMALTRSDDRPELDFQNSNVLGPTSQILRAFLAKPFFTLLTQ